MIIADLIERLPLMRSDAAKQSRPRAAFHQLALDLSTEAGLPAADCRRAANCLQIAYDLVPDLKPLFFWPDNRHAFCLFPDHSSLVRFATTLHRSSRQGDPDLLFVIHEIETLGQPRNDLPPGTLTPEPFSFKMATSNRWIKQTPFSLDAPISDVFASPPPSHTLLGDDDAYDFYSARGSEASNWEPDLCWEELNRPLPPS